MVRREVREIIPLLKELDSKADKAREGNVVQDENRVQKTKAKYSCSVRQSNEAVVQKSLKGRNTLTIVSINK